MGLETILEQGFGVLKGSGVGFFMIMLRERTFSGGFRFLFDIMMLFTLTGVLEITRQEDEVGGVAAKVFYGIGYLFGES